jgi:hypothetical protein
MLVVADKADIDEHWTETGKDLIGVISTASDDTVVRLLAKRFQTQDSSREPTGRGDGCYDVQGQFDWDVPPPTDFDLHRRLRERAN